MDNSVISGADQQASTPFPFQTSSPISPADAAVAAASINSPNPAAPPAEVLTPAMAPPDVTNNAINPTAPPIAPTGGAKPGLWAQVLQGALVGLAGSAGQKHFGGGLGAGADAYLENQQRQIQNQNAQKQLQFETVKAADSHILALKQAKEADAATEEHQVQLINQQQEANEWADEHGQPEPFVISADNSKDMHAAANGALSTLANANGGQVPAVTATNKPATTTDPTHTVHVYAPTAANVDSNVNGALQAINTMRAVQNPDAPPLSATDLLMLGGQKVKGNAKVGVAQMWQDAQQYLMGVPPLASGDSAEKTSSANQATAAHLQQQLDRYKASPNPEQSTVKLLQSQLDTFKSAMQNQQTGINKDAAALTTSQEAAKKPFVEQEHQFQNQLQQTGKTLDRQNADQNSRSLKADEMVTKEANDRDSDLSTISGVQKQLQMATKGNEQAYQDAVTRFAEHEVAAGGMKRFNDTEAKQLGPNVGSWGRQLDTYASKGFTGKGAAPTIEEMNAVLNLETKQRQDLYNSRVGNIQQHILGQQPATKSASSTDPAAKFGGVTRN